MCPLVRNILPILEKWILQTKRCIHITRKYVPTTEKACYYRQKHVSGSGKIFPLLGKLAFTVKNMCFLYWEKQLFQVKIFLSTRGKYVLTTGKTSFYRQKYVFQLLKEIVFTGKNMCVSQWEIFFHYSEKQFLQTKICISTTGKHVSTTEKVTTVRSMFTAQKISFYR